MAFLDALATTVHYLNYWSGYGDPLGDGAEPLFFSNDASPPSDALKRVRTQITAKWGLYAFYSAIFVMAMISISNLFVAPKFQSALNSRPSIIRKHSLSTSWLRLTLGFWTLVVFYFCVAETYDRLDFFVKRLGRVCVALMPPLYLLTMKPSPLPRTFYLQVLPMHKWLSRVVIIIAFFHAIGYTYKYYLEHGLYKLKQLENVAGIAAMLAFLLMAFTAWAWYRRRSYEIFYTFHILSAWFCLILIKYHARPKCDAYMLMCLVILVVQLGFRVMRSGTVKLRVQNISQSLVLIDIPKKDLPKSLQTWSPAAHIRLSSVLTNPMTYLRSSHPYTVANLSDEPTLKLIIRKMDYKISFREKYAIMGPHRSLPSYIEEQVQRKMIRRALLVIGGSGIAFGAPILRYFELNGIEVKLIWAIRDPLDAKVLPQLGLHQAVCDGKIEVYYTGERINFEDDDDENNMEEEELLSIDIADDCCRDIPSTEVSGNGRQARRVRKDDILRNYVSTMYNCRPHLNLRLKSWLYSLDAPTNDCCCADRLIQVCEEDRLGAWVFATGAPRLVDDTRKWAEAAGVSFFQELFSL